MRKNAGAELFVVLAGIALDLQCVDPAYQRRGAGRMLVRWGTELADKMGVKVRHSGI